MAGDLLEAVIGRQFMGDAKLHQQSNERLARFDRVLSAPAPPQPKGADRAEVPKTKRWYRRRDSIAGALRLIVIRRVPFELAHQVEQAFWSPARDKFL